MGNILVVKNNTDNTEYIALQKNHTITIAQNLKELDKILAQQKPDTIILDIQEQEKRTNIYLNIKENKKTRKTPILLISKEDPPTSYRINNIAEAYLREPYTPLQLLESIENVSKIKPKKETNIQVLYIASPDERKTKNLPTDGTILFEKTTSPTQALEIMQDNHYDCILLSYVLIDTNGIQFYEEIKTQTDIPVILYTGKQGENIAEKAYEAGLDDFIRRGYDMAHYESLYERIHKAVNQRNLQRILEHNLDLVENVSDAIISTDHKFCITSWNKAAEKLYGWNKEETINRFVFDLKYLSVEDGAELGVAIWEKGFWEGEQTHKDKTGKPMQIFSTVCTIKNRKGEVVGYVSVNHDITENKKALTENAAYKKRLEALYTYSVRLDQAKTKEEVYKITFDAIHDAIDAKYHELKIVEGPRLKGIYPVKYKSNMPIDGPGITTRTVRKTRTQRIDNVHDDPDYVMGKDWTDVYSEMSVPVLIEGIPVAVINVEHEEKSAFKEQDQTILETFALSVSNALVKLSRMEELEDTIKQRTLELEESYRQLKDLDKNKDQFISTATHELRTPLTSIIGYLDLVQEMGCEGETIRNDYCPIIRRNTERLIYLTDNLLDQQRINMNRLNINKQRQDIITLTTQIIEDMKLLADEKNIKLQINTPIEPLILDIDPLRAGQVITNLLDNAIKFSENDSVVKVTVTDNGDEVVLSVKDQGYGLRESDFDELFKPFPGIDKPVHYRSTGLGLSISKGIVKLHGGRIWAISDGIGKGSTFSFALPKV